MKKTVVLLLSCLSLAACGGGDDSSGPPTPNQDAAGFYSINSTGIVGATVVFGDGTFYSVYGTANTVDGFIAGSGTSRNGSFTSSNARDYFVGGVLSPTLSASYLSKRSISGSVTYTNPARTVPFTGNYDAFYEATQPLTSLVGSFSGNAASPAGTETASVTVAGNGTFTGSGRSGCTFTGTATPKTGSTGFDVSMRFGVAPCTYPSQSVTGVAIVRNGQLIVMVTTADKNGALLFAGNRS